MTREEAIFILERDNLNNITVRSGFESLYDQRKEAFSMAIKALEQEPTTKIEESNFSQEQYLADLQSAYDCGKSVLDKIRAEIIDTGAYEQEVNGKTEFFKGINYCLSVIDKHKAEMENP